MSSLDGRPLIVLANRLPVTWSEGRWEPSSGGLVTALRPVVADVDSHWVGWDDGRSDVPQRVDGLDVSLVPISLDEEEVAGFYDGVSNSTLWPLFHDLLKEPVIDHGWWQTYTRVNQRFADVAAKAASALTHPDPVLWVQDYHLMLAPQMLRSHLPDAKIGFFLHIPFPPPELVARLPWRDQLLDGLLGADAIGFHTEWYRSNFVRSVERARRDIGVDGHDLQLPDGRTVRTSAHPISIDADAFSALACSAETERELQELRKQFEGRRVFLGVDRLDYTKGIRHRLQAIELLLEADPALREHFAFVQVAVPSRDDVAEYQLLREEVEQMVGHINGRFTEPGQDVPVHYLYRSVPPERLAAYYRLADVMCVTPLKDGLNLVAKEFVAVQGAGGEAGVLLLSEFTGVSEEFVDDALLCHPFDVERLAGLMQEALQFDRADRRARIENMARQVADHDVFAWVRSELKSISST